MHDMLRCGAILEISPPINNFPLIAGAASYLFIAGGIGITPILPMLVELHARQASFRLYYCAKSPEHAAFRDLLYAPEFSGKVLFHFDGGNPAESLDIRTLLATYAQGTLVYCCGPERLMCAVRQATLSWPRGSVQFEYFQPAAPESKAGSEQFEVFLRKSGSRFQVPPHKSIAQVLREEGVAIETSCETGICGTCRTRYLSGNPVHADFVLTEEERQHFVMLCCARARGLLVLDL